MNSNSSNAKKQGFVDKLRKPRVVGIAIFDLGISLVAGGIIGYIIWSRVTKNKKNTRGCPLIPIVIGALSTIPIGIATHAALGIPTALNNKLGISGPPEK